MTEPSEGTAVAEVAPNVAADAPVRGAASRFEAGGLRKSYRSRTVVNDVSLGLDQGEVVGLLGPNGAGKTTIFYMMVGIERPDQGTVRLDGDDLTRLPMYLRARRGISYLPQEASIFRKLTVEQNIMAIHETLSLSRRYRQQRLEALLE
jgi:lipopolysaccharide export system ATP-binding protein